MKNEKKLIANILSILIIIMIIIMIVVVICIITINKSKPKMKNGEVLEKEYNPDIIITEELKELNIRNKYYIVKNIVEDYYYYLCDSNLTVDNIILGTEQEYKEENIYEIIEEENKKKRNILYNFLDNDIIKEENITTENIHTVLGTYKDLFVSIEQIKYIESKEKENLTVYYVSGQIVEKESRKKEDFLLMIVIDSQNSTFNIYTEDYTKKHKLTTFSQSDFKKLDYNKIDNRNDNKYKYKNISDEMVCADLLKSYTNNMKYNTEKAYELLKEEYRNKKFNDLKDFENYSSNFNLQNIFLDSYTVEKKDGEGTVYVAIDNNKYTYIFYSKSLFSYDVILDTYTVDLPQFIEKYEDSNIKEKVALNIKKFMNAVDEKDYNYAYGCLADSFKNNYFKDIDAFKRYIENNFPNNFEVSYLTFEQVGEDYYTYLVKMSNGNNQISKTFIMKLGEKTNFELSFNV